MRKIWWSYIIRIAPETKTLFPAEMVEQKKKLMQTLAVCVNGLNNLGEIVPAVLALGRRHVDYKVSDEHYDSVGAALLWTLEQGLGEDFTPETSSAWTTVYGILATTMKDAAAQAA